MSSDRFGPDDGATSLIYIQGESIYGGVALPALANGWTLIPQERGERRRSSIIDGRALKWGEYMDRAPTEKDVAHWARQAPSANAAILLGKPSGLVYCLDIDVLDEALALRIVQLADQILGRTPFSRVGMAPKIALFYRAESLEEMPPNRSWRFLDEEHANPSVHGLEVQGQGKLITAYGYHHKTERYFAWGPEGQPADDPVSAVPLVKLADFELFIEAVQDIRPFHRNGFRPAVAEMEASTAGVRVPKFALQDRNQAWVEDPSTGKVTDGREALLWHLALTTARGNVALTRTDEGIAQLKAAVAEQFQSAADMSGKWTKDFLSRQLWDKVGRAARDVREGRVEPLRATLGLREQRAPEPERKFLAIAKRKVQVTTKFEAIDDAEKSMRKLNLDRDEASHRIQAGIEIALKAAVDAVYDRRTEEVHVIPGATGSGKTSRAIRMIAEDPRTKCDDHLPADSDERLGPWVFVLPTYNNIAELRTRAAILGLDPSLDDEGLAAQAAERGLLLEGDNQLQEARLQAINSGLRVEQYKGKVAAGCLMKETVEPLMKAGIRTGQMCKTKKRPMGGGEPEEVLCDHYHSCPAIAQRERIKTAHVVVLVQNFLTIAIPEQLKKVRGVILDERIFHLVLHGTTFDLKTLEIERREPKLTKKEIEAGLSPFDLIQSRHIAAEIVIDALRAGRDPAAALMEHKDGFRLAADSKRVCGAGMAVEQAVYPMMTPAEVAALLQTPTGTQIAQEWRFWSVVEDRMTALARDVLARADAAKTHKEPPEEVARGETDSRIQYLRPSGTVEQIRVSWADDMNWSDTTRILLDASMDPEITARLFPGSTIITHAVDTDLNLCVIYASDQNWAISGLVPRADTTPAAMLTMAARIDRLRQFISRMAGIYAHGCVLVAMPKSLREVVQRDWVAPYNVDFGHLGALKGLDYARRHVAAISIGRLEPPTEAIDAQVGAMTYHDPVPEKPIDALGTGVDYDGKSVGAIRVPRRVKLRDRDAIVASTEYTGELAQRLQRQYREEETRQFIGRLRPIHRPDTVDAIVVGQSLPEDIVVDALTTFDALQGDLLFWDLVRRAGGIIDVEAMSRRSPTGLTVADVQDLFDRLQDRDEVLKRYHRVTSKSPNGVVSHWYLPGYFSDDEADVRAYAQSCAPRDEILTIGMCGMTVMPAARAPMDAINAGCADTTEQRRREAAVLKPVVELVMKRGEWRTGPMAMLCRAGTGELERERATLGAWMIVNRWLPDERAPMDAPPAEEADDVIYDDVM